MRPALAHPASVECVRCEFPLPAHCGLPPAGQGRRARRYPGVRCPGSVQHEAGRRRPVVGRAGAVTDNGAPVQQGGDRVGVGRRALPVVHAGADTAGLRRRRLPRQLVGAGPNRLHGRRRHAGQARFPTNNRYASASSELLVVQPLADQEGFSYWSGSCGRRSSGVPPHERAADLTEQRVGGLASMHRPVRRRAVLERHKMIRHPNEAFRARTADGRRTESVRAAMSVAPAIMHGWRSTTRYAIL